MSEIRIRRAAAEDVPEILAVMEEAHQAMADQSQYITDDRDYIARHIRDEGFVLVAEEGGVLAGFLMVSTPKPEDNDLGQFMGFSEAQCRETAIMDSAAVRPGFQGKGILGLLSRETLDMVEPRYPCLLGTVAEENLPSRRNFEKMGFSAVKTVVKPGGYTRLLMMKGKPLDFPPQSR